MAAKCDVIFVCVKPYLVQTVLRECKDVIGDKLVISIAAGVAIEDLEAVSVSHNPLADVSLVVID